MYDTDDTGYRARLTLSRGTIVDHDDSKMMQIVSLRGLTNELVTAERFQAYGFTSAPVAPSDAGGLKAPEVVVGFVAGDRSHPVVVATDDRRYRPKNLKPGESKHHDDQGQYSHLARDGHVAVAKNHSITAGSQPEPGTHELNDQAKGMEARIGQLERGLHGLFDVTSRLRMIAQGSIPGLAVLAPILNQDPSGLPMMEQAILGKAQAYLQQHVQQALDKFMSSPIAAVSSILGGQDTIIAALQAKISGLISANPVVATVDGLLQELADLNASGSPAVVAQMAPVIQGLIDSAAGGNPIVGQVAQLRSQLAGLMAAAGDGLNFLGAQQRIPQRLTRSLQLSR